MVTDRIEWRESKPVYDGIHPRAVAYRFEPKYDIHPSESDLDDESLDEQVDLHRHCYCESKAKRYDKHTGDDSCGRCTTTGAHEWTTVCACCGKEQSRFEVPEYLEAE